MKYAFAVSGSFTLRGKRKIIQPEGTEAAGDANPNQGGLTRAFCCGTTKAQARKLKYPDYFLPPVDD